jgi:hypothetical protein
MSQNSPASASAPASITRTVLLGLNKEDIGRFVGPKGMSIRKFVVTKSRNAYARDQGVDDFSQIKNPHVTIKHLPEDDVVVAECSAECESILDLVESNLGKHIGNFNVKKDKICRLVFKTRLPDSHIGKYIGTRGKNCQELSADLENICSGKKIDATGFRIRIQEQDVYDSGKTPNKFFHIKNGDSGSEVFIHVSSKFSGSPRDLFLTIKSRMIQSVTSLSSGRRNEEVSVDFLQQSTPFTPNLSSPFGGGGSVSDQEEGEMCPDSPKYCSDEQ